MTPKSTVSVDSFSLLLASAAAFTSSNVSMLLKLRPAINFCAVRLLKSEHLTSFTTDRSLKDGKLGAADGDEVEGVQSSIAVERVAVELGLSVDCDDVREKLLLFGLFLRGDSGSLKLLLSISYMISSGDSRLRLLCIVSTLLNCLPILPTYPLLGSV